MATPKVGEWREIEMHDPKVGWYLITGFVLEKKKKKENESDAEKNYTEMQITKISVNPEVIDGKYLVGKPAKFKTSQLKYCFMNDARNNYYELMRDMALIHNQKDEFLKYSELITLMKD